MVDYSSIDGGKINPSGESDFYINTNSHPSLAPDAERCYNSKRDPYRFPSFFYVCLSGKRAARKTFVSTGLTRVGFYYWVLFFFFLA